MRGRSAETEAVSVSPRPARPVGGRRIPVEIAPNVFEIELRRVRAHLIVEETLTLIDAGLPNSVAALDRGITALGHSPVELRRVVCTHGHFDHAGGAAEYANRAGVE